jgi:hypothetical protein
MPKVEKQIIRRCVLNLQWSPFLRHPQRNGMVERVRCQIKDLLRAHMAGAQWPEHLPWVLMGVRAAPKEDTAISLVKLVLRAQLDLLGQLYPLRRFLLSKW